MTKAEQTETAIPMNDLILKKSKLSTQALDCYDLIMQDSKQYSNEFCIQYGALLQMIRKL